MTRIRALLAQPLPRWWTEETVPSRLAWVVAVVLVAAVGRVMGAW